MPPVASWMTCGQPHIEEMSRARERDGKEGRERGWVRGGEEGVRKESRDRGKASVRHRAACLCALRRAAALAACVPFRAPQLALPCSLCADQ